MNTDENPIKAMNKILHLLFIFTSSGFSIASAIDALPSDRTVDNLLRFAHFGTENTAKGIQVSYKCIEVSLKVNLNVLALSNPGDLDAEITGIMETQPKIEEIGASANAQKKDGGILSESSPSTAFHSDTSTSKQNPSAS